MSAETLDTIAALTEVFGFFLLFGAPFMASFWALGKLVGTERSSW